MTFIERRCVLKKNKQSAIGRLFGADNRPKHYRCTSKTDTVSHAWLEGGYGVLVALWSMQLAVFRHYAGTGMYHVLLLVVITCTKIILNSLMLSRREEIAL